MRDAEASSAKASSSYDKACHLADLGASLRDAVHARDAKKETLDRVAQDAGTGGRRSRRDITRDLKRLQDEKEAAVNKRAQVCVSVFVIARASRRRRRAPPVRRRRDSATRTPSPRLTAQNDTVHTQAEKDKAEGLQQENAMISRKAEASKAVSDLEQQLAEKRRWEASRDEATKTKRDCEKREKDIKADAPARKAALDKAKRDQEEATSQWTARKKKARSKTNGAKAAAYAVKQAVAQASRGDKRIADAEKTLAELQETKARFERDVAEAEDAAADVNAQIADASKSEDTRMLEKKEVEGA